MVFEIATSVMTILAFFYAGKYKWWGWLLGLISEMMWNAIIIYQEMWGLLPQSVFLLVIYSYNMVKWYKRNKREEEMANKYFIETQNNKKVSYTTKKWPTNW